MTLSTFAAALGDRLSRIERAAMNIEQGGRETDLHELRMALTDVLCLIERDPGIEAATEDLYETALAVARDATTGPPSRRLRLLREVRIRYRERLAGARPSEELQ